MKKITPIKALTAKSQMRPTKTKAPEISTPKMKLPTIPMHRDRLATITPSAGGKGKKT